MDEVFLDNYSIRFHESGNELLPWWRRNDNMLSTTHRFSVIASPYNGLISPYLGYPFFRFFGYNEIGLRVFHLSIGAASVFFTFWLMSSVFASLLWPIAGTLLLVSDSNFFISFRTQYQNGLISLPFLLASLCCLTSSNITKKRIFLSGVLLGLALFGYFNYWCLVPACFLWWRLFGRDSFVKPRNLLTWGCGILVGIAPLIYAYISMYFFSRETSFPQFVQTMFFDNLTKQTTWLSNLHRLIHICYFMIGNAFQPSAIAGEFQLLFVNFKSLAVWLLFLVGCVQCVVKYKDKSPEKKFFGWCVFSISSFLLTISLFGTRIGEHHLIVVLPIVLVSCVYPFCMTIRSTSLWLRHASIPKVALWTPVAFIVLAGLVQQNQIVNRLRKTGGLGYFSDAIYQLRYSVERNHRSCHLVLPDWGFWTTLVFLTEGKLDYSFVLPTANLASLLDEGLGRSCVAIVAKSPRTKKIITEGFRKDPKVTEIREAYKNRLGDVEFELFRFQKTPL